MKQKLLLILALLPTTILATTTTGKPYISLQGGWGGLITPKDNPQIILNPPPGYDTNSIYPNYPSGFHKTGGLAGRIALGYSLQSVRPEISYGAEIGYGSYTPNKYAVHWYQVGIINQPPDYPLLYTNIDWHYKYKAYSTDILGIIKYNFATNWHITGKLGATYVAQKLTGNVTGYIYSKKEDTKKTIPINASSNKIRPEIALGIEYNFTPNVSVDISSNYIFGSKPSIPKGALNYDTTNNTGTFNITNINDVTKAAPISTITLGLTYFFS